MISDLVKPLQGIFSSINYPLLNNIKIISLISSTIIAILAARKTNLVLSHVFAIVALNMVNLVIILLEILDVGTEEERADLTDSLIEVCKYRTPKDKLMDATSREEAIKIYREEDLDSKFLLPNCTYNDLDKFIQKRYYHKWIFDVYNDQFLSMWWEVPIEDVEYMRRILQACSFKGAVFDSDSEKQTLNESYLKLFYDVVGRILGVITLFVTSQITGQKFTPVNLFQGFNMGKDLVSMSKDFTDQITTSITGVNPKKELLAVIERHSLQLNKFLETPAHYYATRLQQLYKVRDLLVEVEQFIRTIPRDYVTLATSLTALHGAACVRKNEIFSSELPNFSRQEPFVVLFRGKGGIGKTHFARHLARRFVNEILPGGDMAKDYIEITPQDKYWPPLSGQRVALFDEAATVTDFHGDLLMANLKSICSPAYFNCAAADVTHKISPCTFQLVFATSNTSITDIAGRIAAVSSAESVYSYFRRMIVVETTFNGDYDFGGGNRYYDDYRHLKLNTYEWDENAQKPRPVCNTIRADQLYDSIKTRFSKMEAEHSNQLRLANLKKESAGTTTTHFSINLNGPVGVGKTPNAREIVSNLHKALGYPIIKLSNVNEVESLPKQMERSIVFCDDLILNDMNTRLELALMQLYNEKLVDNSILIFCTNREYKFSYIPKFTPFGIEFPKLHTFTNIGVTRRVGYSGNYIDGPLPSYNREFHFRKGTTYTDIYKRVSYKSYACVISVILFFLPLISYKFLPLILLIFPLLYMTKFSGIIPYFQLSDYIYDSYLDFLRYRQEIEIIKEAPPNFEPNFVFEAQRKGEILVTNSSFELQKHVFIKKSAFDLSTAKWKFLMERSIAISLQNNYEKFLTTVNGVTEETIFEVMKKFIRTFVELNVDIKMSIRIGDLGQFDYYGGKIYVQFKDQSQQELLPILHEGNILLGSRVIPLNMDLFNPNFNSILNLNLLEAIALKDFLASREFLSNPLVKSMIRANMKLNLKNSTITYLKEIKDKLAIFYATPLGKLVSVLLFLMACAPLIKFVVSKFSGSNKLESRVGAKKIKVNPKYRSDEEKHKSRVGAKKIKVNPRYRSDEERQLGQEDQREDVITKCDMNKFQAYRNLLDQAHSKARKNLCQVYVSYNQEQILNKEPIGKQACYGMFIGNKTLITVAHVLDDIDKNGKYNLYVGADEFEGFHKCTLISRLKMREISIWRVDSIPIQYPNISKQFMKKKTLNANDAFNVALERLAPGKVSQWFQGEMIYWDAPYSFFDGEMITEFGRCDFATVGIKATSFGDCGLPYYAIDPALDLVNVIIGIHFAGNVQGFATCGSCAVVYREEIEMWLKLADNKEIVSKEIVSCKFCSPENSSIQPASKPTCDGHEIVWSDVHESSPSQFYGEMRTYFKFRPNFEGLIIKNSGPLGYGSVEHSHTQFLPNQKLELSATNGWKSSNAGELGISGIRIDGQVNCVHRVVDVKFSSLFTCLNSIKQLENFRVYAEVYVDSKMQRRALIHVIIIDPNVTEMQLNKELVRESLSPLSLPSNVEVYVNEDIMDIFNNAQIRFKRNILPDVPFEQVKENQTVKIIGTLSQNASRIPNPMFKKTPFSDAVKHIIPVEKAPVEYNVDRIPENVLKELPRDRFGNPDARIGQSIQWAHKFFCPDVKFREYCRSQFVSKIYQHYSNLRLLSDVEIFEGYPYGHRYFGGLSPLELDKSIGFTMKQLYHVQHKSDVIGKTPEGKYFWHDNEAAQFAKQLFQDSQIYVSNGNFHYSAYLELLKMEKLKLQKIYTGRTFCAQDLNGVLIERWVMGNFSARAIKEDPTCGVGTNAYNDFHNIYLALSKFNNMFTGDYKRFDRTCPWSVFEDVRLMLIHVNPHIKNEINSVFNSLQKRIQISGTTVVEVTGGMPSGCTITAPLNCLNNDYMLYCAFVRLANAAGFNTSYLSFDRNVVRRTYGDDVIVSVSDDVSKFYNMTTVSNALYDLFGMTLDSSAKDGTKMEFETYEEASWISRFFRRLDKFPFYVGALKKISIGSHLHYSTSLEPAHLGSLFTTAQWEAALWEQRYFDQIQNAIRIAIKKMPSISKHFQFRSRLDIQTELFDSAQLNYIRKEKASDAVPQNLSVEKRMKTFFESYKFDRQYRKHIVALCDKVDFDPLSRTVVVEDHKFHTSMSFVSRLNEAFQAGYISKPLVQFQILNFVWTCEITFCRGDDLKTFTSYGKSKAEAREGASLLALQAIDYPIPAARTVAEIQ